jgi:hypothetical protein
MDNKNRRKLSGSNIVLIIACALIVCILGVGAYFVINEVNRTESILTESAGITGDDELEVEKPPETPDILETLPTETVTEVLTTTAATTISPEETTVTAETTAETVTTPKPDIYGADKEQIDISLYSFTTEVPNMVDLYFSRFPERAENVTFNPTTIATTSGLYEPALYQALATQKEGIADIYCTESSFTLKYTRGDAGGFAATYEDMGIDAESLVKSAQIAEYSVDLGRNEDGEIVGLGYQSTAGAFIYRRSVAIDTWGTDDPDEIAKKVKDWDSFLDSAGDLKAKGYYIVSTLDDVWQPYSFGAKKGWVTGTILNIDPAREAFLDYAKTLTDKKYVSDSLRWSMEWRGGMSGDEPVFGYFGPSWLVTYTMSDENDPKYNTKAFGDWAVCAPPEEFFWGGTWIHANKAAHTQSSPAKQQAIADFIEWVTLDTSETGLQHAWAKGETNVSYTLDAPMSGVIMERESAAPDLLGGQDMFEVFSERTGGDGSIITAWDYDIESYWLYAVRYYVTGEMTKEQALESFIRQAESVLNPTNQT